MIKEAISEEQFQKKLQVIATYEPELMAAYKTAQLCEYQKILHKAMDKIAHSVVESLLTKMQHINIPNEEDRAIFNDVLVARLVQEFYLGMANIAMQVEEEVRDEVAKHPVILAGTVKVQ